MNRILVHSGISRSIYHISSLKNSAQWRRTREYEDSTFKHLYLFPFRMPPFSTGSEQARCLEPMSSHEMPETNIRPAKIITVIGSVPDSSNRSRTVKKSNLVVLFFFSFFFCLSLRSPKNHTHSGTEKNDPLKQTWDKSCFITIVLLIAACLNGVTNWKLSLPAGCWSIRTMNSSWSTLNFHD